MECFMIVTSQTSYQNGGMTSNMYLKKKSIDVIKFLINFLKKNYDYLDKYHTNFVCCCNKVCYEFIDNLDDDVYKIVNKYNNKNYDSCYNYKEMLDREEDSDEDNKKINKKINIKQCKENSEILNKINKNGDIRYKGIKNEENEENNGIEKIIFITLDDFIRCRIKKDYFCEECEDKLFLCELNVGYIFDMILNKKSVGGYWLGKEGLGINIRYVNLELENDDILTQYDFRS